MPRPKRAKVAPSVPAPRIKKATRSMSNTNTKVLALPYNEAEVSDISDSDEGVVTSVRHVKRGNGNGKSSENTVGRIGRARIRDEGRTTGDGTRHELQRDTIVCAASTHSVSSPELDLGSSDLSLEVSRRENSTHLVDTSRLSMTNFRRRPRQPSILGRGPGRPRSSSVESNMAEDNGLMSVGRRNNSTVAAGNFRQRARQLSIGAYGSTSALPATVPFGAQIATPARPSVLNLGNFKRRAREPSILGTAQKRQASRPISDAEDEQNELDDFNPEDESTPLNVSKSRARETSSEAGVATSSRKRKLSSIEVLQPSEEVRLSILSQPEEAIPATLDENEDGSEPDSLPEDIPIPSVEASTSTPEPFSETMAPPRSSSPSEGSPELPILQRRHDSRVSAFRGRRPLRRETTPLHEQESPISSPPSLTHSPNRYVTAAKPKQQRLAPPPSTFSTAQLQTLMPRRRRTVARDSFDIPSSEDEVDPSALASEDDELSHLVARTRTRRPAGQARTLASTRKPKAKAKPKSSLQGPKRIYGSGGNAISDKENEEIDPNDSLAPLPDDDEGSQENSQELEKRVGTELKRAARKFAEVDQWEMEFEDVTASSSSPRDAR